MHLYYCKSCRYHGTDLKIAYCLNYTTALPFCQYKHSKNRPEIQTDFLCILLILVLFNSEQQPQNAAQCLGTLYNHNLHKPPTNQYFAQDRPSSCTASAKMPTKQPVGRQKAANSPKTNATAIMQDGEQYLLRRCLIISTSLRLIQYTRGSNLC